MATSFGKWLLFFSSYFPLFVLLCIENWRSLRTNLPFTIAMAVLLIIAFTSTIFLITRKTNKQLVLEQKTAPANCTTDIIEYFITYLIPLLSMDINRLESVISNCLIFLLIGLVFVRSNRVHLGPLLLIAGYALYQFDNKTLISRKSEEKIRAEIQDNGFISVKEIAPDIYISK